MSKKSEIKRLKSLIEYHNIKYYEEDRNEISDEEYDELVRRFRKLSDEELRVGGRVKEGLKKVKHERTMLSLDNVFNESELEKYFSKIKVETGGYTCELKLDGIAISLRYENGKLVEASTRGDGRTGEDVSENIKYISSIPKELRYQGKLEIRGEIIIPKRKFIELNEKRVEMGKDRFSNPRNAASGIIRQINSEKITDELKYLEYYGYYVIGNRIAGIDRQIDILGWLSVEGFKVQENNKYCENIEKVKEYIREQENKRKSVEYETDGIVIKVDKIEKWDIIGETGRAPRWAVAYKYASSEYKSRIREIEMTVGRTGVLTPVALFDEVIINGVKVTRALLHNYEEIERKDIMIGDEIIIRRAGEVIPEVVRVNESARTGNEKKYEKPKQCPICGGEIKDNRCMNGLKCRGQLEEGIIYYCSSECMNIKGMGRKLVKELVKRNKLKRISDIYEIKMGDIAEIPGMGKRSSEKLMREIEGSKDRELERIIRSMGIRYVGKGTCEILARRYNSMRELENASYEELIGIEGIGELTAKSINEYFKEIETKELMLRLREHGVLHD